MTAVKDPFTDQLDFELEDDQLIITKKRKRNIAALIFGILLSPILFLWGFSGFLEGGFILVLIGIYAGYNAWRTNSRGLFPVTEIDFNAKSIIRRGAFPFVRDKINKYKVVHDLGFGVKAVGGHTSAYDEGNTDYRKTLILETDSGDIRLCNYGSRNTDLEDSVIQFARVLKARFGIMDNPGQQHA